ncbi:MAG: SRPBCC family protein [Rhodospirillaceae bacterium]
MIGGGGLKGGWEAVFPAVDPRSMFEVISGFDAYPHFVPGCLEARILEREGEQALRVETVFGVGPTRFGFTSRAVLDRPGGISLTSCDGPWRSFRLEWKLAPEPAGCRVRCRYAADFRSWLIAGAARMGMAELDRQVVAVLEKRVAHK